MTIRLLTLGAGSFAVSLGLSLLVLRYAVARSLLDLPNERSLHRQPTPRGGGLAIVLVVLGGVLLLTIFGRLPIATGVALLGGGVLVASVGWMDDRHGVRAPIRFFCHATAAIWALVWLSGMPRILVGDDAAVLGWFGAVLAFLGILWTVNFYNFMDGIDGLAAAEAASVGALATILLAPRDPALAAVAVIVAGAATGFLPVNWSPARIFMGDVGSGFLGYSFAVLALASENSGSMPALLWLLLIGVFFLDATLTLFRRIFRGERWYAAHRSHAYQRSVQAGWSHRRVAAAVLLLNAGLGALAWLVGRDRSLLLPALAAGLLALAVAYVAVERKHPMGPC
jgi:Fuc2NAc and GlcNAc transferase